MLRTPPLRAVGRLSYSWYLWHWPVLVLAPAVVGHPLNPVGRAAAAAASAVLALVTLVVVEDPLHHAAALRRSPRRSLALGGALTAAGVCAALLAGVLVPPPVGRGAAASAPRLHAAAAPGAAADPAERQLRSLTAQVQAAVAASADLTAVPANLTPPLADAAEDRAAPFRTGCLLGYSGVSQPPCVFGDTAGTRTVALVGDSHAAAWTPSVEPLALQRHWRLDVFAKTLCPLLDLPISSPYLQRSYTECESWRAAILDRLRAEHPLLVVLAMSRRYGADFGFTSYDPAWLGALTRTVAGLRATGAAVLVLGPVPDPHSWVPTCLSDHLDSAVDCFPDRAAGEDAAGIAAEAAATAAGGGRYADVSDLFCTAVRCPMVVGDQLVLRDDNHITTGYAGFLAPVIAAQVDRALPGG